MEWRLVGVGWMVGVVDYTEVLVRTSMVVSCVMCDGFVTSLRCVHPSAELHVAQ